MVAAMDTKALADALGTDTKSLRRYLRDPKCPVKPVGSGARYTFRPDDVPALSDGFKDWSRGKTSVTKGIPTPRRTARVTPVNRDALIWAEEEQAKGPVTLSDIRDPRVRAAVRREAARQEAALSALLMAKGLHITQKWERERNGS